MSRTVRCYIQSVLVEYLADASELSVYAYYFSLPGGSPSYAASQQINNAIISITASLAGNGATFGEQLQFCTAAVINSADPSSVTCLVANGGPYYTTVVIVNSILQQSFGYLPPNLVLDAKAALEPLIMNARPSVTQNAAHAALDSAFTLSAAGPAFVTCFEAVVDCITAVLQTSPMATSVVGGNSCTIPVQKCPDIVRVRNN